jgi:hypothetical protein
MAKTSNKLTIYVYSGWMDQGEIQALVDKGHDVRSWDTDGDLVLHPRAHRWDDAYWKMLPTALTQARRAKKAQKP